MQSLPLGSLTCVSCGSSLMTNARLPPFVSTGQPSRRLAGAGALAALAALAYVNRPTAVDGPRPAEMLPYDATHVHHITTGSATRVAVCLTGLYRIPIIDRIVSQYAAVDARFFVVTDAEEARNWTWATDVQILPKSYSSQHRGLRMCEGAIRSYERAARRPFHLVIRQRLDVLGCTPPATFPNRSRPVVLVPHGGCAGFGSRVPSLADNWAVMSRSALPLFVDGVTSKEVGVYLSLHETVETWTPVPPDTPSSCFRIIRPGCGRDKAWPKAYELHECRVHTLPPAFFEPVRWAAPFACHPSRSVLKELQRLARTPDFREAAPPDLISLGPL